MNSRKQVFIVSAFSIIFSTFLCTGMVTVAPVSDGEGVWNVVSRIGGVVDFSASVVDDVDSKIDALTFAEFSDTDFLASLIDQVSRSVDVSIENAGDVTTFGDQMGDRRTDEISISFAYGISTLNTTSTTASTGTVDTSNKMARVSTGAGTTGQASLQSKRFLRVRPGREGIAMFSARFLTSSASSTQWIGLFDDNDGVALGYNGASFSVLYRRATVDTIVSQGTFNVDNLDGAGSSAFTLDTSKVNKFRIIHGWADAAPVEFQVMNADGQWITFHRLQRPNSATVPLFDNNYLPMRAEVKKTAGTTNYQLFTGLWHASLVGGADSIGNRLFAANSTLSLSLLGGEGHIFTIRNKSSYNSITNKIEARMVAFAGGLLDLTAATGFIYFRKNATVTGTTFSDIDTTNSIMEMSTAGSYTASTGTTVLIVPVTSLSGLPTHFFPSHMPPISLLPGETLTITATTLTPLITVSGAAMIAWEERF